MFFLLTIEDNFVITKYVTTFVVFKKLPIAMTDKSTRRKRFETVAARRTQKILEFLDSLSNCSNRSNYEFNESDVKKIFTAIRDRVKQTETAFEKELGRSAKIEFKL